MICGTSMLRKANCQHKAQCWFIYPEAGSQKSGTCLIKKAGEKIYTVNHLQFFLLFICKATHVLLWCIVPRLWLPSHVSYCSYCFLTTSICKNIDVKTFPPHSYTDNRHSQKALGTQWWIYVNCNISLQGNMSQYWLITCSWVQKTVKTLLAYNAVSKLNVFWDISCLV